jgi:glycosyltransferase involved in cell wall biosynthesis
MITTFYPPYSFGGDATHIYRLTNELAKRDHHVDVIHCADAYRALAGQEPTHTAPNHPNVRIHTLRSDVGLLSPLATQQLGHPLFKARAIRTILSSRRFDVIHFHNISLVGGPGILKYGQGIKLYTTHEHWLVCPMHVLWKYNRELCTSKNCFRCTLSFRRPPQWWRYTNLLERSLKHVDLFLAPSRFTLEKHREMGLDIPIAHLPYFLPIPNGPSPEGRADENGRPYFLFVGRLEKIKGLQTLFPVFRNYSHADLLVAGDGTYEPTLRALARDIPQVKFVGRASYERLRQLYRNAIAVLVPSICYEVFGIIIIEAFAERTPVIVHDLGAPADAVRESRGGLLYRDEIGLRTAMEQVRCEAGLRETLGKRGHEAYRRFWSETAHLHQYLAAIADVARRKPEYGEVAEICSRLTNEISDPAGAGRHYDRSTPMQVLDR